MVGLIEKGVSMLDLYANIGNALIGMESALRIAISNADNFNTPGYKYSYATFTTVYSQVISSGTPLDSSTTTNPIAIGSSMTLGSTSTDFKQGNLGFGTNMDVAISGEGFFLISQSPQDFESGSPKAYSRGGRFQVDVANQFITDPFGRKVYGYKLNKNGKIASNQLVPIETNKETDIGFSEGGVLVKNFQANKDAVARGDANPPALEPMYQLALTTFQNKQGLLVVDGGAYQPSTAAGEPLPPGTSGQGIYGSVLPETLEASNINVSKVALDMALLNRGFSAIQGVIDDCNKVINGLISKLQ